MSALPSDLIAMKDSPTYLPILRSVLKSQIQFLVEQLSGAGEETLILSANVNDGLVDQFGSEAGKLFANVYDDFKSEFLGFCQKRKAKRKQDSPLKPVEAKRGRTAPAVLALPKTPTQGQVVQAVRSTSNVPKVSSARIITNKSTEKPQETMLITVSPGQLDSEELGESEEGYTDMGGGDYQYEEEEEEEEQSEEWEESEDNTPSSSQPSTSRVKTAKIVPKENTSFQNTNKAISKSESNTKTIRFEKSLLIKNSCPFCNKVFGSVRDLNLHIRSHTGEKPYKCDYCGQTFSLKRSAEKHVLKQHQVHVSVENV